MSRAVLRLLVNSAEVQSFELLTIVKLRFEDSFIQGQLEKV